MTYGLTEPESKSSLESLLLHLTLQGILRTSKVRLPVTASSLQWCLGWPSLPRVQVAWDCANWEMPWLTASQGIDKTQQHCSAMHAREVTSLTSSSEEQGFHCSLTQRNQDCMIAAAPEGLNIPVNSEKQLSLSVSF